MSAEGAAGVSVVIPVYNNAAYLAEAVDSVRRQSRPADRIILVDDGSTDATPQVAADLRHDGRTPEVRYLRKENGGPASALNLGLAQIEEGYVAFLDADDLWVPDKLAWQFAALAESGCDLVFGHARNFISPELDPAVAAGLQCPPEPMPATYTSTLLTRVETFRAIGPFDETLRLGEFLEWYGRVVDCGMKVVMLPQVVAMRRLHGRNHSLTRKSRPQQDYPAVLKAILERRRAERRGP